MATQFRDHPKRTIALGLLALLLLWIAVNAIFHLTPGPEPGKPDSYTRYKEASRAERLLANYSGPCSFGTSPRVGKPVGGVPETVSAKVPSYVAPGVGVGEAAEKKARSEARSQRDWLQHYLPDFWRRGETRFRPLAPASLLSLYRRSYGALVACEQTGIRALNAEVAFLHRWNRVYYANELDQALPAWERYKQAAHRAIRGAARSHRLSKEARRAGRRYLNRLRQAARASTDHRASQ